MIKIKYQKVTDEATVPTRGSRCSAGHDLYSRVDAIVSKKSRALIPTGIKMEIPEGCYGRIAPKSSLSLQGVDIGGTFFFFNFESSIISNIF